MSALSFHVSGGGVSQQQTVMVFLQTLGCFFQTLVVSEAKVVRAGNNDMLLTIHLPTHDLDTLAHIHVSDVGIVVVQNVNKHNLTVGLDYINDEVLFSQRTNVLPVFVLQRNWSVLIVGFHTPGTALYNHALTRRER